MFVTLIALCLAAAVRADIDILIQFSGGAGAPGGVYQFIPPQTPIAAVGTVIRFNFTGVLSGNHSVTQSSFANPCTPLDGGFDSGFLFGTSPIFNLTITNDTEPIWFYCKQLIPTPHCPAGMVGAINAPTTGETFAAFQRNAATFQGIPGQNQGDGGTSLVGVPSGGVTSSSGLPTNTIFTGQTYTFTMTAPSSGVTSTNSPERNRLAENVHPAIIAGSVVGGLAAIILIIILLRLRNHNRKPTIDAAYSNMKSAPASVGPHSLNPFMLSLSATHQGPHLEKPRYRLSETERTSPTDGVPVTESTLVGAERSGDLGRVQQLNRERERINRELASLEQSSALGSNHSQIPAHGGQSAINLHANQQMLAAQLGVIQTQMRQLEERWQHGQFESPPLYDNAPAAAGHAANNSCKKFLILSILMTNHECKNRNPTL